MSPGGGRYPSPVTLPRMIRFSNVRPGVLEARAIGARSIPVFKSSRPWSANDSHVFPGERVDRVEITARGDQYPSIRAIFAFPVVEAALPADPGPAAGSGKRVNPQFFPARRIQRDQRSLLRRHIGYVIHHQRTERIKAVPSRITPGNLQLADICRRDLLQWRIMRAIRTSQVVRPVGGNFWASTTLIDIAITLAVATTRRTGFIAIPRPGRPVETAAPADCIITIYLRSAVSLRTVNEFPSTSY